MATLVVTTIEEMNQAIAQGIAFIYRPKPLNSAVAFNTSSGVSNAGLGSTSSSVSGGLGLMGTDATQAYNAQQEDYSIQAQPIEAQIASLAL